MPRTLFTNARVFDGTGAPVADGQVVVEDGLIREVGLGLDGDEVIDLGGRGLLPGLFDTHVHVAFTDIDLWRQVQKPFSLEFYETARNLMSDAARAASPRSATPAAPTWARRWRWSRASSAGPGCRSRSP